MRNSPFTKIAIGLAFVLVVLFGGTAISTANQNAAPGEGGDPSDGLSTEDTTGWKRKTNVNRRVKSRRRARKRRARRVVRVRRKRSVRATRTVPDADNGSVIATFAAGTGGDTIAQAAAQAGLAVTDVADNSLLGIRIAKLSGRRAGQLETRDTLRGGASVQGVQPNFIYQIAAAAKAQYAVGRLQLDRVRKIGDGSGVSVAVLDSGVEPAHPAFSGHEIARFDALGSKVRRRDSHGTAVSSIIAARDGMIGMVPQVRLLSARTFAYNRRYRKSIGETFHLLRGLDWAVSNDAKVLNLSFAGPRDPLMERALTASRERGAVAVAAAGNKGPRAKPAYPAAYDSVIAVTATDRRDRLYRRSNRGDYIHIAAPGVNILSASGKRGYRFRSGTSMATAYVSGAVAIMLQRTPDLSPENIANKLGSTAQDLGDAGRDRQFGHGLLDVLKATAGQ